MNRNDQAELSPDTPGREPALHPRDWQALAYFSVYRLVLASLGLAGGVFLLLPGGSAMRREFREAGHD